MTAGENRFLQRAMKAIARLLSYPEAPLQSHAAELAAALRACPELDAADGDAVEAFARWLADSDLLAIQAEYVETFDRGKQVSLHLFEHVYGESRDRGPAMVELARAYREHGLVIRRRELPDYLPLFLEFCAELSGSSMREWIAQVGPILQRVHVRLAHRNSRYATPFRCLLRLALLAPAPEALRQAAAAEERDDTPAALDRDWREAPVAFGPEPPACGADRRPAEQPVRWMDGRVRHKAPAAATGSKP